MLWSKVVNRGSLKNALVSRERADTYPELAWMRDASPLFIAARSYVNTELITYVHHLHTVCHLGVAWASWWHAVFRNVEGPGSRSSQDNTWDDLINAYSTRSPQPEIWSLYLRVCKEKQLSLCTNWSLWSLQKCIALWMRNLRSIQKIQERVQDHKLSSTTGVSWIHCPPLLMWVLRLGLQLNISFRSSSQIFLSNSTMWFWERRRQPHVGVNETRCTLNQNCKPNVHPRRVFLARCTLEQNCKSNVHPRWTTTLWSF